MKRQWTAWVVAVLGALTAQGAAAQTADTCRNDPKFREQDFTVGSWDVYTGATKTDEVTMTLILNDCVIEERWKATDGKPTGNGVGLFNYSRLLGSWGYTWATDDGAATVFRGNLVKPGEMRYVTEKPLPGGPKWRKSECGCGTGRSMPCPMARSANWQWAPRDGGKTWTTDYDLKWVRKK